MKKKIIGGLLVLAIAAVAAFNMNLNLAQESNMSPLALANVEALAQNENSGGNGSHWNCTTYTSDSYTEYFYCDGKYTKRVTVDTRNCNSGMLSWCYPGYISTYYNCDGSVSSTLNNTNMSGCN
jgi:hypothetical protein